MFILLPLSAGATPAPSLNRPWPQRRPSKSRRSLVGLPAASALCWAQVARLVRPTAPDARLFRAVVAGAEECPSSFVIKAMGEPDVWGTAIWRISLSRN